MTTFRLLTLASAAVLLPAQESARFAGPTSGFLFDAPSRAIRVVMGVPGAAYLGAAAAENLDNGSVSPSGRLALAVADGAASLLNMTDGSRSPLADGGCGGAVAWNADSSAVAVGCTDGVHLYRLAGNAAERATLASFAAASKALALDASGRAVFAAAADGIYRIDAESARLVAPVENAGSLVLAGETLFALDRAGKQVVAIDQLQGSAALRTVLGAGQGLEDPTALGLSADGSRLYVAEGESKSLRVFNAATAEMLSRVELDFAPGRVDALGNGLFLLNARKEATDTVQVLDARQLAVFFIPAQDLGSVANLED